MLKDTPAIAAVPFRPLTPYDLFRFDTPDDGAAAGGDDGTDGGDQRPEWLPENFKTPEDLAKSYSEAERKIHEQGQRLSQLEQRAARAEELEEWYVAQQQAAQRPTGDPRQDFLEVWEDPDRQAELVLHMASTLAQQQEQLAALSQPRPDTTQAEITAELAQRAIRERFGDDWDTYGEQVSEIVGQDANILGLTPTSGLTDVVQGLERVMFMVKGQALSTDEGRAAADAAEAARVAKQAAITQSGSSTRPPTLTDDEAYAQRIRDAAKNSGGYGG